MMSHMSSGADNIGLNLGMVSSGMNDRAVHLEDSLSKRSIAYIRTLASADDIDDDDDYEDDDDSDNGDNRGLKRQRQD